MINNLLFRKDNIVKKTYFWNLAANVLFALQSAILLLVVSRSGTLEEAGVFAIIYSTTHMLSGIGNYSMRNFQVSDAENEYCFQDYWTSRVISCGLMGVIGSLYGLIRYGLGDSLIIVLCFVGYRITDSIEDVIHGLAQKEGRLDAASIIKTARVLVTSIFFTVTYLFTKDLKLASAALLLSSVVILFVSTKAFNREFDQLIYRLQFSKVWKLLWVCLPLCASALIQTYISNSPKYAIDRLLSAETQAIYNILFMPVFSINLLVMFIFNPIVAELGRLWTTGRTKEFLRIVVRQSVIIVGFTAFAAACCYFFGCELLGFVYGVDLSNYKVFLMVLMLFGGITAMVTFISIIVTIIRKQQLILVSYLISVMFSFLFSDTMVQNYGMEGAGYLYGILMTIVLILLTIVVIKEGRQVQRDP